MPFCSDSNIAWSCGSSAFASPPGASLIVVARSVVASSFTCGSTASSISDACGLCFESDSAASLSWASASSSCLRASSRRVRARKKATSVCIFLSDARCASVSPFSFSARRISTSPFSRSFG